MYTRFPQIVYFFSKSGKKNSKRIGNGRIRIREKRRIRSQAWIILSKIIFFSAKFKP